MRRGSFHISQKVDYGLYFLAALEGKNVPRSTRTIAKEGGISFSFLQKVAHLLKRAGLVAAVRGKEGGYCLARSSSLITINDIVKAVDRNTTPFSCSEPSGTSLRCPRKNFCLFRSAVSKIHHEVMGAYLSKKLSDFIKTQS